MGGGIEEIYTQCFSDGDSEQRAFHDKPELDDLSIL